MIVSGGLRSLINVHSRLDKEDLRIVEASLLPESMLWIQQLQYPLFLVIKELSGDVQCVTGGTQESEKLATKN